MKFLLVLILNLGNNDTIPRPIIEWCLECNETNKILKEQIIQKEIKTDALIGKIGTLNDRIGSFERDSISHVNDIKLLSDNYSLKTKEVELLMKKVRKKILELWLERGIAISVIAILILISL